MLPSTSPLLSSMRLAYHFPWISLSSERLLSIFFSPFQIEIGLGFLYPSYTFDLGKSSRALNS